MPLARERGSALVVALLVIVILTMIGSILMAATTRTRDANKFRSDRVAGIGPADAAMATYRFGLQTARISDQTGWAPTEFHLRKILGADAEVISNRIAGPYSTVDTTGDGAVPTDARLTVVLGKGGTRQYWQVYRVQPPDPSIDRDLRVWIRAWVGGADPATSTTNARVVVATFRQGRFSDFQMVSDGPIRFDNGGVIRGPVHSNGADDATLVPPASTPSARIWAEPGASINCPAEGAAVTTAVGTVNLPASCRLRGDGQPTNRHVSLQGMSKTFSDMLARCTSRVLCIRRSATTYTLQISGRSVTIDGVTQTLPATKDTIFFDGSVRVVGQPTGRLTVAAFNENRPGAQPATIYIDGNVGTRVDAATNFAAVRGESMGLFAQGDIVVNPVTCPTLIHGVLISNRGQLTIGRERMTSQPPTSPPASCPRLVVSGAIAGNFAPKLSWRWPDRGVAIGYTERSYLWDTALRDAPPPFTPVTGTWENATFQDANAACFTGARAEDPTCV